MYLGSSLVGMARVCIGFPLEHPIDAIRVQWQARPHFKNEFQIAKSIYTDKGIVKGFYAGSIPNLFRLTLRNSYKYPLLVGLPDFYRKRSPAVIQKNERALKLATGFSIALIESIITCPIDRMKTYLMTSSYQKVVNHDSGGKEV